MFYMLTIQPGWTHKEDAAKLLGVSIRQLENLAALKRIRKNRLPRQVNERSARVLYSIEDIQALKAGKPNQQPDSGAPPAAAVARREQPADSGRMVEAIEQLAKALSPAPVVKLHHAAPRPWLNLREAVEYSGLPAWWLVEQARVGKLRAVNVGRGDRDFWRFNREGLAK